ncbi:dynein heavy chain 12, axonemal-like isoform X1 [Polypterus senegalus]|uniref:dynein heavy chain 12, axonemal-like isoform X1 n=1 Tax=Polypterus senegalus TaxID=55291 RepID=UPI001966294C|nr:dynein heavy chain 12, axonemal-like isoform X1 [Polypterus senegalus]XP_039627216.1 dynein heavy chain 12, axonemal-like isoform X1 [Polypterus senegalus]
MDAPPEDGDWDVDISTQSVIEQSLQEFYKAAHSPAAVDPQSERVLAGSTETEQIFAAIAAGDEKTLQQLAVHRYAFREADADGWLPLHKAAAQKEKSILEITLQASSPSLLERTTLKGETVLQLSVSLGLAENATFLLLNGCSPDAPDEDGDSPLVTAIKRGSADLATLLIRFGADVNRPRVNRRTALHEAAQLGHKELVSLLLRSGAHPDPRSAYGLTPLALAAQYGHTDIVRILLEKGASVDSQARDYASVLFEASSAGNPDTISLLLEYGADANVPKHSGHLPIHRCAYRGHLTALELLIPATDRSAVKESGMSPLHSAAAGGHYKCLDLLLKSDYDINLMLDRRVSRGYDDQRRSALYFAVSNNDIPCTKLLLEAGALPNQDPVNCLQVALRIGNYELISLLLRYGANVNYFCRVNTTHFPSALQYALKDETVLRMLLSYGYDVCRCFDCPHGDGSHVPSDYEGWSPAVIKDNMFCEVITLSWLKHLSGKVVRTMLDYVDHVRFCSKLKTVLVEQKQWPEICYIQENPRSLMHLCRLKIRKCLGRLRLRAPVFMAFLPLPDRLKEFILYKDFSLNF